MAKPGTVEKSLSLGGFTEVMVVEPTVPLPSAEPASQLKIKYAGIQISADSGYPVEMLATLIQGLRRPC
jgi:hypothetical protein